MPATVANTASATSMAAREAVPSSCSGHRFSRELRFIHVASASRSDYEYCSVVSGCRAGSVCDRRPLWYETGSVYA